MSRAHFQQGLSFYKSGSFQEALEELNKAIQTSAQPNYIMYDTRAAVYVKLGKTKEALQDSRKTIEVASERWHGYARAARLFLDAGKVASSATMVKMALERTKEGDTERRISLLALEEEVLCAAQVAEKRRRRFTNYIADLPIEVFGEIARLVVHDNFTASIPLSQVSKDWRAVIHGNPRLWNILILGHRRPKQKAKLWIERSKGMIRELHVQKGVINSHEEADTFLHGLDWDNLCVLKTNVWDSTDYLRKTGKHHILTQLEHLDLEHVFCNGKEILPQDGCPSLLHLALRNIYMTTIAFDDIVQKITNLRSLELHDITLGAEPPAARTHNLNRLLEANPILEKLSLYTIQVNLDPSKSLLDHLTILEIKNLTGSSVLVADLPALRVLRVEDPLESIDALLRHISEKCSLEGSQLTEIVLRSCPFRSDSLIKLLENSPALQILEVSNLTGVIPVILEALAASYSSIQGPIESIEVPTLCPNLTHINFSKCDDVQTGPLVRMIKSRLPPLGHATDDLESTLPSIKRIESLIIDECHNVDSTWLDKIRKNVRIVSCVYMKKKTKFRAS